jgi:peptide/nickel transport system permease protein
LVSTGEEAVVKLAETLRAQLGLDVPVYIQYFRFLWEAIQGDFGQSLWTRHSVTEDILFRLPISLQLGLMAIIFSLIIGLPVGIISGIRPDSGLDQGLRSFSILCICVPEFWLGLMVVVYPALWWGWAPPLFFVPFVDDPLGNLSQMFVPALIQGMLLSGITMRFTRTMMLEVLRQDYVRTAWAKGLPERVVILRHVLKNATIPVLTMIGLQLPVLIGGAVIVEKIFNIPGLGSMLVTALEQRDYPIVTAINLLMAGFVLVVNLLIDVAYAKLDPRIQYE